jgi:S1-C subfamily serine protease/antitoxin component YwqK of YwqJK toxin-antitoxin module
MKFNRNSILLFLLLTTFISFSQTLITSAPTLQDQWVECNKNSCKIMDPYFLDGNTMEWEGSCINGKANGFGKVIKYLKGIYESTYEGSYVNGIREGKGKFSHYTGTTLECDFINGQAIGTGTYTLPGGNKYIGEIFNYRQHGLGTLYFANGSKFEGFFVSDNQYTGKYTKYDGTVKYIQAGLIVDKLNEKETNYHPKLNEQVTEYFDLNWKRSEPKNAAYFRQITYKSENRPKGIIRDYYISGELQSEYTCLYLDYDDENKNFYEYEAKWYYKNGKIQQTRFYYNNKINGRDTYWYENGQKSSEANYDLGDLNGYFYSWYPSGNLKYKSYYEKGVLIDNRYLECDENGECAIIYNELFSLNASNWEGNDEFSLAKIDYQKNNVYIKNKKNNTVAKGSYIPFDQTRNFSIETNIDSKNIDGSVGFGLGFGFLDWNNFYGFLISGNGSFKIYGKIEGLNITIQDWTFSKYINNNKISQSNQLKVLKINDTYIFSVNGEVLSKIASQTYPLRGQNTGILIGGEGEVIVENLMVKEFIEKPVSDSEGGQVSEVIENDWMGNGSGFFINEKGFIATNYHVVKDANFIQVEFFLNGIKKAYSAKVINVDKLNDIAIIKITDIDFKPLPKIPYSFSSNIRDVGTSVFTLGYPLALDLMGEEIKFTDGKISAKTGFQGDVTVYQVSVPVQPGNSGGPLFDNDGNLIGIVSSGLSKAISENVNYAIKATYLKNLIDVLPQKITIPNDNSISNKPLTEKIRVLTPYIPIIKIK